MHTRVIWGAIVVIGFARRERKRIQKRLRSVTNTWFKILRLKYKQTTLDHVAGVRVSHRLLKTELRLQECLHFLFRFNPV